ncbi:MAG: dUTP diphosphatase, partial [Alphaproteobacteria bacterium]|nr:dUTP diphosphatase [Alphaproteobacteria bacterium]
MTAIAVAVTRLPHGRDLPLPSIATAASAGVDLLAAIEGEIELAPGERRLVPTGLAIALPPGTEAQ